MDEQEESLSVNEIDSNFSGDYPAVLNGNLYKGSLTQKKELEELQENVTNFFYKINDRIEESADSFDDVVEYLMKLSDQYKKTCRESRINKDKADELVEEIDDMKKDAAKVKKKYEKRLKDKDNEMKELRNELEEKEVVDLKSIKTNCKCKEYVKRIKELEEEIDDINTDKQSVETKVKELRRKNKELKFQINDNDDKLKKLELDNKNLKEVGNSKSHQLEEELNIKEEELTKKTEAVVKLKSKIDELFKRNEDDASKNKNLEETNLENKKIIQEMEEEIRQYRSLKESCQCHHYKDRIKELERNVGNLQQEKKPLEKQITELLQKNEKMKLDLDNREKEKATLAEKLENVETELKVCHDKIWKSEAKIQTSKAGVSDSSEISDVSSDEETHEQKNRRLKDTEVSVKECEKLKRELIKAKKEMTRKDEIIEENEEVIEELQRKIKQLKYVAEKRRDSNDEPDRLGFVRKSLDGGLRFKSLCMKDGNQQRKLMLEKTNTSEFPDWWKEHRKVVAVACPNCHTFYNSNKLDDHIIRCFD